MGDEDEEEGGEGEEEEPGLGVRAGADDGHDGDRRDAERVSGGGRGSSVLCRDRCFPCTNFPDLDPDLEGSSPDPVLYGHVPPHSFTHQAVVEEVHDGRDEVVSISDTGMYKCTLAGACDSHFTKPPHTHTHTRHTPTPPHLRPVVCAQPRLHRHGGRPFRGVRAVRGSRGSAPRTGQV